MCVHACVCVFVCVCQGRASVCTRVCARDVHVCAYVCVCACVHAQERAGCPCTSPRQRSRAPSGDTPSLPGELLSPRGRELVTRPLACAGPGTEHPHRTRIPDGCGWRRAWPWRCGETRDGCGEGAGRWSPRSCPLPSPPIPSPLPGAGGCSGVAVPGHEPLPGRARPDTCRNSNVICTLTMGSLRFIFNYNVCTNLNSPLFINNAWVCVYRCLINLCLRQLKACKIPKGGGGERLRGAGLVAVPAWWRRCWWGGSAGVVVVPGAAAVAGQEPEQLQSGVTPPGVPASSGVSPCQEGAATSQVQGGEPPGAERCGGGSPEGAPRSLPQFPQQETPRATAAAGHRATASPLETPNLPPPPPSPFSFAFSFSLPLLRPLVPSCPPGPGGPVPPEPGSVARPCHASSAPLSAVRRGCPGSAGAPIKILCEV